MRFIFVLIFFSLSLFDQLKLCYSDSFSSFVWEYVEIVQQYRGDLRDDCDIPSVVEDPLRRTLDALFDTYTRHTSERSFTELNSPNDSANMQLIKDPEAPLYSESYDRDFYSLNSFYFISTGEVERDLPKACDFKTLDIKKELSKLCGDGESLEHLIQLQNDVRNLYDKLYKGLFVDPQFSEIDGLQAAYQKFREKSVKIARINHFIERELKKCRLKKLRITRAILIIVPDIGRKWINVEKLIQNHLDEFNESKNVKTLESSTKIITELTEKVEKIKALMQQALYHVNMLTEKRVKWFEEMTGIFVIRPGRNFYRGTRRYDN